jgi:hypothetical protein
MRLDDLMWEMEWYRLPEPPQAMHLGRSLAMAGEMFMVTVGEVVVGQGVISDALLLVSSTAEDARRRAQAVICDAARDALGLGWDADGREVPA